MSLPFISCCNNQLTMQSIPQYLHSNNRPKQSKVLTLVERLIKLETLKLKLKNYLLLLVLFEEDSPTQAYYTVFSVQLHSVIRLVLAKRIHQLVAVNFLVAATILPRSFITFSPPTYHSPEGQYQSMNLFDNKYREDSPAILNLNLLPQKRKTFKWQEWWQDTRH